MSAGAPAGDELRHLRFSDVDVPPAVGRRRYAGTPAVQQSVRLPVANEPEEPDEFILWALRRVNLDPAAYRSRPLDRRLPACLRTLRVSSPLEARRLLEEQPGLLPKAVSSLLLGVTDFFRDKAVFENLRRVVLPTLAQRPRPLRIWCAGCSQGQELYSVAILLDRLGLIDRCELVGTDCRADAIQLAQQGSFSSLEMRQMDEAVRARYFVREGREYRAIESLRSRLRWRVADVLLAVEDGPWDMVLCRNLAIYLRPAESERLWRRLADTIAPGGYLVLGKAERPPTGTGLTFQSGCIYRKDAE